MHDFSRICCPFIGIASVTFGLVFSPGIAKANNCHISGPIPRDAETASWYGKKYHSRRTANGERFNKEEMTAAHPTLPLGSFLKVTNLANGLVVHVRITDRQASYTSDIDLSEAAARALKMRSCGLAYVMTVSENDPSLTKAKPKTRH